MSQGMQTDYKKEAAETVAIKFKDSGKMFVRSSYPPRTWQNIVSHAYRDRNVKATFILEDDEEGQAILRGTEPSDMSVDYLMGMSEENIRTMALEYDIKLTAKSNKKSIALRIMAAIADGVKRKEAATGGDK